MKYGKSVPLVQRTFIGSRHDVAHHMLIIVHRCDVMRCDAMWCDMMQCDAQACET